MSRATHALSHMPPRLAQPTNFPSPHELRHVTKLVPGIRRKKVKVTVTTDAVTICVLYCSKYSSLIAFDIN